MKLMMWFSQKWLLTNFFALMQDIDVPAYFLVELDNDIESEGE